MTKENKYHFGREIIFNLRSCHAINEKVYLHWIDKLQKDEDGECITKTQLQAAINWWSKNGHFNIDHLLRVLEAKNK